MNVAISKQNHKLQAPSPDPPKNPLYTHKGSITVSKKETVKRYILFIISLFIAALGVAFTKHGELGVSVSVSD